MVESSGLMTAINKINMKEQKVNVRVCLAQIRHAIKNGTKALFCLPQRKVVLKAHQMVRSMGLMTVVS